MGKFSLRLVGEGREESATVTNFARDGRCHVELRYRDRSLLRRRPERLSLGNVPRFGSGIIRLRISGSREWWTLLDSNQEGRAGRASKDQVVTSAAKQSAHT